jgi:hypothetical protein
MVEHCVFRVIIKQKENNKMPNNPNAPRDKNFIPALLGTSSTDGQTPIPIFADPTTHRLLVDLAGGNVISTSMQKDTTTSTNGHTVFIPSKTLVFDFYISVNGAIQTPSADYSIIGGNYVLNSPIPSGCAVILLYSIT